MSAGAPGSAVERRAGASLGASGGPIYGAVAAAVARRHGGGGTLVDVGCGTGGLLGHLGGRFGRYVGADVVRHEGLPAGVDFRRVDLDAGRVDLPDAAADVVACVETIEHVENPRALFRELARLARPGGLVVVSTPNQASLMSKLSLLLTNQYPAFRERPGLYPAHITALLPADLERIAAEVGLAEAEVSYTGSGRIPGTPRHWPRPLGGRAFSDNVLLAARRP